jgi:hypothetical protein
MYRNGCLQGHEACVLNLQPHFSYFAALSWQKTAGGAPQSSCNKTVCYRCLNLCMSGTGHHSRELEWRLEPSPRIGSHCLRVSGQYQVLLHMAMTLACELSITLCAHKATFKFLSEPTCKMLFFINIENITILHHP